MRTRSLQRMAAVLLCVFLCLGTAFFTMGAASAAELEDTANAAGLEDAADDTELEDVAGIAEMDEPPADTQPPVFGVGIELTAPEEWTQTSASVALCVTDETGGGFASVEVRMGEDEVWLNITESLEQTEYGYRGTVQVTENGTFFARVTGLGGEITEKSCAVVCFDTTAPDLRASIVENTLRLEAADDLSGVEQITVGGASFEYGTAEIPLDELGYSELIPIQVVDCAGNRSQMVLVVNPCAHSSGCPCNVRHNSDDAQPEPTQPVPSPEPTPSQSQEPTPVQTQKPAESTPAPSPTLPAPVKTPSEPDNTAQISDKKQSEQMAKPLTPDGQATVVDDATDQDGKEFFTFTTPDENTFYLVIDRQRDSENVYFLNAVTESDLLALAEKDKEPEPSVSAIPEPEPVCTCTDKCVPGAVNTGCPVCAVSMKDCTGTAPAAEPEPEPEPEKPEKGSGAMILLLIAVLAAGGAGYYLKIWKPKHDLDDAEDFDELTGEDEETVNEDDLEPTPLHGPGDEPEEPDFLSGYGPEEDE